MPLKLKSKQPPHLKSNSFDARLARRSTAFSQLATSMIDEHSQNGQETGLLVIYWSAKIIDTCRQRFRHSLIQHSLSCCYASIEVVRLTSTLLPY